MVAVDGGTVGLEVQFGAFLAVILGLLIPCVFLITMFIQSEAAGTGSNFRQPDYLDMSDGSAYRLGKDFAEAGGEGEYKGAGGYKKYEGDKKRYGVEFK